MSKIFWMIIILSLILIVGCTQTIDSPGILETAPERTLGDSNNPETNNEGSSWMTLTLKDLNSGQSFKLTDFQGKKILLESFAVWCPVCTSQQRNIKKLHEELGDGFVSIALDTDPNEDEDLVKNHAQSNEFDWRYAVAPKAMTQALVDEFGIGIVSAPSAPMILICEDGSTRFLQRGLKSVNELKEELENGC